MNKARLCIAAAVAVLMTGCAGMSASPGKRELIVVGNDEKVAFSDAGTRDKPEESIKQIATDVWGSEDALEGLATPLLEPLSGYYGGASGPRTRT